MPPGPGMPPPIAAMGVFGPMARSVDDLTLAYNLMRGPHPGSPTTVPTAEAHPERVNLKQLKVAVGLQVGDAPVDREIRAAVERAAKALAKLGVAVDDAKPPIGALPKMWLDFLTADGNELLHERLGENIRHSRERLRFQIQRRPGKSAADFFRIAIERDRLRAGLAAFMERYPVIIAPPFGISAFEHGAVEIEIEGQKLPLWAAGSCATWVNCTGLPAAAVPAGRDRAGLPIGVQIVGRAFDEETVLAVARALEAELGGFVRPPLEA
jgi:amidase